MCLSCPTDKPISWEVWQIAHPGGLHLGSSSSRQAVTLNCLFALTYFETNSGAKMYWGGNLEASWFSMCDRTRCSEIRLKKMKPRNLKSDVPGAI